MDDHSGGGRSGPHWGGGRRAGRPGSGSQHEGRPFKSSYLSVNEENFHAVFARMSAAKPQWWSASWTCWTRATTSWAAGRRRHDEPG